MREGRAVVVASHAQVGPFGDEQQPDLGLVIERCEKQGCYPNKTCERLEDC